MSKSIFSAVVVAGLVVCSTLSGSVVAKTNFKCGGGSSTSLSRALKASDVIWCASSMM